MAGHRTGGGTVLVADALVIRGPERLYLLVPGKANPYPLTGFARLEGLRLLYLTEER